MELAALTVVGGTAVYYSVSALRSWWSGGVSPSGDAGGAAAPTTVVMEVNRPPAPGARRVLPHHGDRDAVNSEITSFPRSKLRGVGLTYAEVARRATKERGGDHTGIYAELRAKLSTIAAASAKSPDSSPDASRPASPQMS